MVRKKSTSRRSTQKRTSKTPTRTSKTPTRTSKSPSTSKRSLGSESTIKKRKRTKDVMIAGKTYKVNVTTLRSIKLLQMSTVNCIPKLPFSRIVREMLQEVTVTADLRVQMQALQALQEAAEIYMTTLFEDSNLAAIHAKRITLMPNDMKLVERLRKNT